MQLSSYIKSILEINKKIKYSIEWYIKKLYVKRIYISFTIHLNHSNHKVSIYHQQFSFSVETAYSK